MDNDDDVDDINLNENINRFEAMYHFTFIKNISRLHSRQNDDNQKFYCLDRFYSQDRPTITPSSQETQLKSKAGLYWILRIGTLNVWDRPTTAPSAQETQLKSSVGLYWNLRIGTMNLWSPTILFSPPKIG